MPPSDAARILGVSADTIRAWCDSGQLRCERTSSGHRLVRRSEVERVATERSAEPQTRRKPRRERVA